MNFFRKNELEICKQLLGPNGPENLPVILTKLKQEYENQVKRNEDKRHRLELFEGLGPDYRKVTDKYLDMEKKIRYTKITLDQLDVMFK